jgi:hypothetical protein
MVASVRRFGAAVLAGLAVLGILEMPAHGQPVAKRQPATVPATPQGQPNYFLPNGMTLPQFAYNTAVLGNALAQLPPQAFGYNPALTRGAGGGLSPTASLIAAGYGAPGAFGPGAGSLVASGYGASPGYGGGYGPGAGYVWDPWGWAYLTNPFTGYLQGAADVTMANARYEKIIQEARLVREEANRSAIDTRRKFLEEAEWERAEWLKRYDPEVVRQKDQAWELDRARHDPPQVEILSGKALNSLFTHVAKQLGRGEKGPRIPLSEDILKGINLTGQDTRANAGLLKFDGRLQWPLSLDGSEFKDDRERINKLIAQAVDQAKATQPVDSGKLRDLRNALNRMNETLLADVSEMSPAQYIDARRYLNQVDDAIKALEDPKVANYFNQTWVAKGDNVGKLIEYMAANGLRFAPAVSGDADSYRALYHALQAYDAGMTVASSASEGGGRER